MQVVRNLVAGDARVFVGMPVFQNARTVQRAIESVKAQGFSDWQLLVTDDCSTDQTFDIATAAANGDPRITVLRNDERQGFLNFAKSLSQADTPFFAWLAGDDYWHPDFLAHTTTALQAAPSAVSALPEAAFVGHDEKPVPNLGFLKGHATDRIQQYLAHPGGTRMYGLMRTEAARASFPDKGVNAYDWFLLVSLLKRGPQLSIPQRLLYRDETDWIRYAEMAEELSERQLFRAFPVLEMSLMLIRQGRIPMKSLPALFALNLRKREEYLAVNRPAKFLRRRPVLRRFGLPISSNPQKLNELAAWHREKGPEHASLAEKFDAATQALGATVTRPRPKIAGSQAGPTITAILTCRNAENTIGAWLAHMARHGCRTVIVDHGSSDQTREIAAAHHETVAEIIEQPFEGYFDLTRQLQLKREIISNSPDGWILHADADEFIDPPASITMAEFLRTAEKNNKIAVPSIEQLFLPLFEDEEHDPDNFEKSMVWRTLMKEHDEKQRIFRKDAPLDLWMRTGGHSITRSSEELTSTAVILRHYPGLSLDDIRGQYYSRVFAPRDLSKLWHTNRKAAQLFEVTEPDPALFWKDEQNAQTQAAVTTLPIFRKRPAVQKLQSDAGPVDLCVLGDLSAGEGPLRDLIHASCPGLRCKFLDAFEIHDDQRSLPVLHLLSHPAGIHGANVQRSVERARASDWTRRIAAARQAALDLSTPYVEVRIEDATQDVGLILSRLRGLFRDRILTGAAGFLRPDMTIIERQPFKNPVRAITGNLAADVGYT